MIEDLKETRHMIFAKHVYNLSYNKDTKEYACDCISFRVRHRCKHIEEFKEYLEKLRREV
ncbi:MAG: hypothetical protein HXS48_10045 [Theionarchaea archaeon]|nr:MAG: hypothetical protein AYK19_07215 [Theionarchaea archaeon DG-70-1]MBU7027271.1 hypothetical protein [Theionarchaea archaeon]